MKICVFYNILILGHRPAIGTYINWFDFARSRGFQNLSKLVIIEKAFGPVTAPKIRNVLNVLASHLSARPVDFMFSIFHS